MSNLETYISKAKENLFSINIILLLLILFLIKGFYFEVGAFLLLLLPYFLLTYKWDLGIIERALLSLPLAGLSFLLLYLLSVWGLALPQYLVVGIVFVLPLIISFIFYKKKIIDDLSSKFNGGFPSVLSNQTLFCVLLIILVTTLAYQGLLNETSIPRTDAMEYLAKISFVEKSLRFDDQIFSWYDKQQLGYPIFTFDPLLSFIFCGVLAFLSGASLIKIFNIIFLFFMIFLTLGVFLLARSIFKNDLLALLCAIIFIATPSITLNALYVGNYKLFAAYAAMPLALHFIYKILSRDEQAKQILGLLFAYIFLSHSSVFIPLIILATLAVFIYHFFKEGLIIFISFIETLHALIKPIGIFLLFTLFFILPIFIYGPYISKSFQQPEVQSIPDLAKTIYSVIIAPLFTEPLLNEQKGSLSVGVLYGVFVILSFIVLAFDYKKNNQNIVHGITIAFVICWIVIFLLSNYVSIVAKTLVGFDRMAPFFALFYCVLITYLFYRAYNLTAANPIAGYVIIILAIAFVSNYIIITNQKSFLYVNEDSLYTQVYEYGNFTSKVFGSLPGRQTTYGLFSPSLQPMFTIANNISTNGLGFVQGQHTDIYLSRMTDVKNSWGVPNQTSAKEIFKLFKLTDVRNIYVDTCTAGGQTFVKKFQNCDECKFTKIDDISDCYILAFLDGSFAEGFSTIPTENNYGTIASANVATNRVNPQQINILAPSSKYILVKEEYFPNWHAYQNGIGEVKIQESDIGLMIVENVNGKNIQMKYELALWEKLLFLISIGGLSLVVFHPSFNFIKSST
ncbi:MAG: hypothetical protein AABX38_03205 [Candidatus Micrarchaeota archaeon]